MLASGPQFAVEGGLERWLRLPFTHPPEVLVDAVDRLARAWESAAADRSHAGGPPRAAAPRWSPDLARRGPVGTIENFPWSDSTLAPLLPHSGSGRTTRRSGRGRGGRSGAEEAAE